MYKEDPPPSITNVWENQSKHSIGTNGLLSGLLVSQSGTTL